MRFFLYLWFPFALLANSYPLPSLIETGLKNSIDLQRLEAQRNTLSAQRDAAIAYDNPELGLQYLRTRPDMLSDKNEYGVALSQFLPKPSLREGKKNLFALRLDQHDFAFAAAKQQLIGQITQAYYNYQTTKQLHIILLQEANLSSEHFSMAQKRFDQGAIPKIELLKLQTEVLKSQGELKKITHEAEHTLHTLLALVRLDPDHSLIDQSNDFPILAVSQAKLSSEIDTLPSLNLLEKQRDEFRKEASNEKLSVLPGIKVGVGYARMFDQHSYMATFSLPLPVWNQRDGEIRAAFSKAQESQLQYDENHYKVKNALMVHAEVIDHIISTLGIYRELQHESKRLLEMAEKSYRLGYGTLFELIEAKRTYFSASKEYYTMLQTYYEHATEIEKILPLSKVSE